MPGRRLGTSRRRLAPDVSLPTSRSDVSLPGRRLAAADVSLADVSPEKGDDREYRIRKRSLSSHQHCPGPHPDPRLDISCTHPPQETTRSEDRESDRCLRGQRNRVNALIPLNAFNAPGHDSTEHGFGCQSRPSRIRSRRPRVKRRFREWNDWNARSWWSPLSPHNRHRPRRRHSPSGSTVQFPTEFAANCCIFGGCTKSRIKSRVGELRRLDQRLRQGLGLEHVACGLDLEQSRVNLAETHQVVVSSLFGHDPILEHANPVRFPDR